MDKTLEKELIYQFSNEPTKLKLDFKACFDKLNLIKEITILEQLDYKHFTETFKSEF